jgi:hypothetical protein
MCFWASAPASLSVDSRGLRIFSLCRTCIRAFRVKSRRRGLRLPKVTESDSSIFSIALTPSLPVWFTHAPMKDHSFQSLVCERGKAQNGGRALSQIQINGNNPTGTITLANAMT